MNFKTFDLNLLRVLDALLATRSTTLAGQRLALSQPAVSAALARLRHALGDPLFIRQGRQLVPSDYATSLQAPLRSLLEQTESMLAGQPDFDPGASTDCLTLSGSDFYAELLMPRLARHLSRLAPGMRVQLVDLVPDNYVQSVGESGVDMAILPATETPDWVEQQRLHGSHFLTVARADHPEIAKAGHAPGEVLPLDLFCGLQHALFSPEGKLHGLGDAALARIGRAAGQHDVASVFRCAERRVAKRPDRPHPASTGRKRRATPWPFALPSADPGWPGRNHSRLAQTRQQRAGPSLAA